MNYSQQIKNKINLDLPESVSEKLDYALATLADREILRLEKTTVEGAFNHTLLIETVTNRYIFRTRREVSDPEIQDYMKYMYTAMGFLGETEGIFRLRTIGEEIQFIEKVLALNLPIPKLVSKGEDWMMSEYIEGTTLHKFVKNGRVDMVLKVVQELHLAHQKGIIYGDRWGDNELINSQGKVHFIDFDIEWIYEGNKTGILTALEVAVTLFNSLRLTSKREDLLDLIKTDIVPWLKSCGYQLEQVAKFTEGLGNFYLDPNKPQNIWSLPRDLYISLEEPTSRLVMMLAEG